MIKARTERQLRQFKTKLRVHQTRGVACGIIPAFAATHTNAYEALRKAAGRALQVGSHSRLEQPLREVRFGVRTLWRSPGLTIAAVMAIAPDIGINVGVFSELNGLALRPLPVPYAQEVVSANQIFHFQNPRERLGRLDLRRSSSPFGLMVLFPRPAPRAGRADSSLCML